MIIGYKPVCTPEETMRRPIEACMIKYYLWFSKDIVSAHASLIPIKLTFGLPDQQGASSAYFAIDNSQSTIFITTITASVLCSTVILISSYTIYSLRVTRLYMLRLSDWIHIYSSTVYLCLTPSCFMSGLCRILYRCSSGVPTYWWASPRATPPYHHARGEWPNKS